MVWWRLLMFPLLRSQRNSAMHFLHVSVRFQLKETNVSASVTSCYRMVTFRKHESFTFPSTLSDLNVHGNTRLRSGNTFFSCFRGISSCDFRLLTVVLNTSWDLRDVSYTGKYPVMFPRLYFLILKSYTRFDKSRCFMLFMAGSKAFCCCYEKICSNEGPTLETSALESRYGGQFTLSSP